MGDEVKIHAHRIDYDNKPKKRKLTESFGSDIARQAANRERTVASPYVQVQEETRWAAEYLSALSTVENYEQTHGITPENRAKKVALLKREQETGR